MMMTRISILTVGAMFLLMFSSNLTYAATSDEVVAATVILEAGGEGKQGMEAVMNIIHNRARHNPANWRSVCLRKYQFSCWNGVSDHDAVVARAKKHPKWNTVRFILERQANGKLKDHTGGASHYHVYRGRSKVSPYWTHPSLGGKNKKAIITTKIGDHVFLRNVD